MYHARAIAEPPYSYTGTFRFGWSLFYIVLLILTAYGFGLPDLVRSPRQAVITSIGAALAGAIAISIVQLFVGDALLPRFVVFGAPLLLIPWYLLCVALAGAATSASVRDRVLVVSDSADPTLLREDVARNPERPAIVIEVVPVSASETDGSTRKPLLERIDRDRANVLVLDREAQTAPSVVVAGGRGSSEWLARAHLVALLRGMARDVALERARARVAAVRHRRGTSRAVRTAQTRASTWRSPRSD